MILSIFPFHRILLERAIQTLLFCVLETVSFITAICIFVPFSPNMPGANLDPSALFGINEAVAQGLAFGRDVIFTFGPYASIHSKIYHPATDHLMLFGSAYLALSFWFALLRLSINARWMITALFILFLASLGGLRRDALLFSYPLIATLVLLEIGAGSRRPIISTAFIIILLFPFGLLSLIKGSLILICGSATIVAALHFYLRSQRFYSVATIMTPVCGLLFFWIMAGQSAYDLPSFISSMIPIISGYSDAMSLRGRSAEIYIYLAISICIFILIYRERSADGYRKLFGSYIFFLFLFLAFKAGFVRHDNHAQTAAISIFFAAIVYALWSASAQTAPLIFLAAISWMYTDSAYRNTSSRVLFQNVHDTYFLAWKGVQNRLLSESNLEIDYKNTLQSLRREVDFPIFPGTTDIYSYNQSYLIASGNRWNPRPIFQSYVAYMPFLEAENKNHLLGSKAPDNLVFSVEPIDGRLASLEDGLSWPLLVGNYQPTALEKGFLHLHKRASKQTDLELFPVRTGTYALGDVVPVPSAAAGPIFAEIHITSNVLGKLVSVLFKSGELRISLTLVAAQ